MTNEKKKLRRLIMSEIDVGQAIRFANYIHTNQLWDETKSEEPRLLVGRGIEAAMIVAYIRPFSGNDENGHTLSRPDIRLEELLTDSEWKLHNEIKHLRDKIFAHSDSSIRDMEVSVIDMAGPTAVPIFNNPFVMKSECFYKEFIALSDKVYGLFSGEITSIQRTLSLGDKF